MKSIQTVLAGKQFTRISVMHRRMRELQDAVGSVLAQHAIVADCRLSLDGGELCLVADTAAAAARIRQILPTLRRSLKNARFPVERIRLSRRLERTAHSK